MSHIWKHLFLWRGPFKMFSISKLFQSAFIKVVIFFLNVYFLYICLPFIYVLYFQPLDHMIKTIEHWFVMVTAPAELEAVVKSLMHQRGYETPRLDNDGNIVVSSFFLMHARAAQVISTHLHHFHILSWFEGSTRWMILKSHHYSQKFMTAMNFIPVAVLL